MSPTPHITIFEGRSRLGGRLAQETLPGTDYLVDVGPNWIHGTDHNPVLDLAIKLNDTTHSFGDDGESTIWDENGSLVEREDTKEVMDGMWGIIVQAFQYSRDSFPTGDIDEKASLYDYFEQKVGEKWLDETLEIRERRRKMCLQACKMWGAFVGGKVERQSLKFFWLEDCLDGGKLDIFVLDSFNIFSAYLS